MSTKNPYAAPQTVQTTNFHPDGVYQDGEYLIIGKRFESHRQCILTGEEISPETKPRKHRFIKSAPLIIILIALILLLLGIGGLLLLLIVATIFQKTSKAKLYFAPGIIKRKRLSTTLSLLALFGGLGLMLTNIISRPPSDALFAVAATLFLLSPILALTLRPKPILSVKKHNKGVFHIKNVHPDFLNHYPHPPNS